MREALKILFIAAEAAPFIKVGGLGDVAGTLPQVIRQLGHDIRLVIPSHPQISRKQFEITRIGKVNVPSSKGNIKAEIYQTQLNRVPVYLIDSPLIPPSGPLYSTDSKIDGPKFVHFSLAALELAKHLEWQPDVLHAHDWHTAPAVYALSRFRDKDPFFAKTASLMTVHNLPYHGEGAAKAMASFGLKPAINSGLPWWAQNRPLALGLMSADHINTVSSGYAEEMLTQEFGAGLHEYLLNHKQGQLTGILNGLDQTTWDPSADPNIGKNYDIHNRPDKVENKLSLQAEFGLDPNADVPLFGLISRMDHQKGVDIAIESLQRLSGRNWQAVILGSGDHEIENAARLFAVDYPDRVGVRIDFDRELGHRIYAGSDAFLIPSRYEPCGLTQMIAMRYGSVPIATAVGGLKDTIRDYDQDPSGTGFLIYKTAVSEMVSVLNRVLDVYQDKRRWHGLQRRGMKTDFSWDWSARAYISLYQDIVSRRMK